MTDDPRSRTTTTPLDFDLAIETAKRIARLHEEREPTQERAIYSWPDDDTEPSWDSEQTEEWKIDNEGDGNVT